MVCVPVHLTESRVPLGDEPLGFSVGDEILLVTLVEASLTCPPWAAHSLAGIIG